MFHDRIFFSTLLRIWVPITLQELLTQSLNFVGVLMIGQLGETAVAAAGLANQVLFLLSLMLFGVTTGSAIFSAQYWGRRDVASIRRVLGLCLAMSIGGAFLFALVAVAVPEVLLGIYSTDPAVIALGSEYLRILGLSFVATAVTVSFTAILRSTESVRLPLVVSAVALSVNTLLSYALIFGQLGLPAMGAKGAAVGTLVARYLECIALVSLVYVMHFPAATRLREMLAFNRDFVMRFLRITVPVALNEILWSFGINMYTIAYARIGTESIAAVNIAASMERMGFVVFFGLSYACAIMIGNRIGAGEEDTAYDYARRFLILGVSGAILVGTVILVTAPGILTFYNISDEAYHNARGVLVVLGLVLWVKVSNMFLIVGILRSGGDTRYSFLVDVIPLWLVGVPLAFAGALVFHLPVYWTVVLATTEEFIKFGLVLRRFFSRRWIHNLVQEPA